MRRPGFLALGLFCVVTVPASAGPPGGPSRPADKDCAWEKLSDPGLGLEAWVERCDYGFRKIDFLVKGGSLAIRYSDGGAPEPVVDVLDLLPGESEKAGIQRILAARTPKAIAARCVVAPYRGDKAPPAGVERFTFAPDAAYRKELDAKASPDGDIPEPPCGDWGESFDGIQYFEAQPSSGSRKVLFVRAGQDIPLFDEETLRLLPQR
jgi:hypothetical protein